MYNHDDYLEFLTQYGTQVQNSPAIVPAFHNYYHIHSDDGATVPIGNVTLINGEPMFPPGNPNVSYPDITWKWYVGGVLKSDKPRPTMLELKPECDGVVKIKVVVEHLPTQVIFTREEWAYLQYTYLDDCPPNPEAPSQFDVFYEFHPDVDPYEAFAYMKWDLTGDKKVNTGDLLVFLSSYEDLPPEIQQPFKSAKKTISSGQKISKGDIFNLLNLVNPYLSVPATKR